MSAAEPEPITDLLVAWSEGRPEVLELLIPRVYEDLRRLARSQLRGERADHTLQPTALVHEAMLRLLDQHSVRWRDRGQFFALAARMMRRILVDYARYKVRDKRGRGVADAALAAADGVSTDPSPWRVLAIDQALDRLAEVDDQLVRLVELRFFGGLTLAETARALGLCQRTVQRKWHEARSILGRQLGPGLSPGPGTEAGADAPTARAGPSRP